MPDDALPHWLQQHRWAVGALIRQHRQAAGLSQVQLAERAGIDHKTVSRAENGVYAVSIDQVARIARALGVSSSELLPGRE
ncbi:transcriptional regulator with XRE-family HTH domain [Streptacidiphilus sp. MAP12-33]|uniref:helix-turn-helix domain-containing protein n=1 Tax=Streptacidiphilus sp. MAP12-33 TaxID=3156266 RepID=UPI003518B2F3